ncbi:integrase domain-containing protein SAM domain-containing protein [Haloferax elongans ATCC BAA-1513]|uniref:Integrase domain-containing protein SAM domain-containing protein n=1 Tax=Haloferax elongans ATCC BAA-1513 TaxID=1230453 RepID=M0HUF9_HALEO|nr:tyrosine-type recombinase/integrase [Haloferax elongans]ELZ88250.1 integrase domain-containing protein SAM domain-containing protein [Haloferax elongans ATCC BAA-1513]
MSLKPIDPESALNLYLTDRENEVSQATIYSHRSRLGHFLRWCDDQGITNLNNISGRDLHYFRLWRRDEGNLKPVTEKTQIDTLRVFIRWLESIDGVEQDLHTRVLSPVLGDSENVRTVMLDENRAKAILKHLYKFEYASRPHVVLTLLWHTMMRVGAAHALDLGDYDPKDQSLRVVHRPETGTPIKNKEAGQRFIALSDDVCTILNDWIETKRVNAVEESGRQPLLATPEGRAHTTTLRGDCYRGTRPCEIGIECPHSRSPETCAATKYDEASKCPSSRSPHAIRRGGITYALNQGWPKPAVSDRANVSEGVLEKHYDQRTEQEKMEQRRQYLSNL